MPFVDIAGPIVGTTVYVQNELVAKDVSVTLPEVAATTADIMAMGTLSLPIWQMLEDMELTINKIGVDLGLSKMIRPENMSFEIRWAYVKIDQNGFQKNIGCKAFVNCIPKVIPGAELTVAESAENEITATVTRYRVVEDGQELWLIDRLAGTLIVNETDFSTDVNSLL